MQNRTVFLFGVLFCVVCVIVLTSAGGGGGGKGGKWMEKMKKCKDGEFKVEEAMKDKDQCKGKGDKSSEETRRRRSPGGDGEGGGKKKWGKGGRHPKPAQMVCMWKLQGVLDSDGKFSESGSQDFVNKVYPESTRTDAMNNMKACNDEHSSKFSMDNDAAGYKDFGKCMFKAHMTTCGIEWGKGKGGKGKGKGKGGDSDSGSDSEE